MQPIKPITQHHINQAFADATVYAFSQLTSVACPEEHPAFLAIRAILLLDFGYSATREAIDAQILAFYGPQVLDIITKTREGAQVLTALSDADRLAALAGEAK